MRGLMLKNEIDFWVVANNLIEFKRCKQQRRYPDSYEDKYINFLYLKGNLLRYSQKGVFEMSPNAFNTLEKKVYSIIEDVTLEESSLTISNDKIDRELILEFNLLKYLVLKLTFEELDEIQKKYDVFTYYTEGDSKKRVVRGCKVLALVIRIYRNKDINELEDFSTFKNFHLKFLNQKAQEFYDTRKNIELSYDYYRVFYSKVCNGFYLNSFSPNLITELFNYYYGIKFTKSENEVCFRSENIDYLKLDYNCHDIAVDSEKNYGVKAIIKKIFEYTRDAVNNYEDSYKFKSYSKALCIPLFKYFGKKENPNPSLIIKNLRTNSISINAEYDIFYWFEDLEGNRYTISYITDSPLDFEILLNKDLFLRYLYQNADVPSIYIIEEESDNFSYLMDIDDIRIQLCNFTLDISELNRDALDQYFKSSTKFKRIASFKKDQEVISTESFNGLNDKIISKQETILFIRLLYLIKIYDIKVNINSLKVILENELKDIIEFTEEELETIKYIYTYLNTYLYYEKENFHKIENLMKIKYNGVLAILESTIKFSTVDKELPKSLVELLIENIN